MFVLNVCFKKYCQIIFSFKNIHFAFHILMITVTNFYTRIRTFKLFDLLQFSHKHVFEGSFCKLLSLCVFRVHVILIIYVQTYHARKLSWYISITASLFSEREIVNELIYNLLQILLLLNCYDMKSYTITGKGAPVAATSSFSQTFLLVR